MAWYDIDWACGCSTRENLVGSRSDREWQIARMEERLCPECYKKQRVRRLQSLAKEAGLEPLTGTEKQIEWAERIRSEKLDKFWERFEKWTKAGAMYEDDEADAKEEERRRGYEADIRDLLRRWSTAREWIDRRDDNIGPAYMAREIDKLRKKLAEATDPERIAALMEATVFPEGKDDAVVCELFKTKNGNLGMRSDYDKKVVEIVKALDFEWLSIDRFWRLPIEQYTGSYEERAAETGNKLLNAGFAIQILDEEVRRKAVGGDYEPRAWKQVLASDDGKLLIRWRRGTDWFSEACRVRGAEWKSPNMVVNVRNWASVLDFADMNGFTVTKSATSLIERYKEEASRRAVKPEASKEADESAKGVSIPDIDDVTAALEVDD